MSNNEESLSLDSRITSDNLGHKINLLRPYIEERVLVHHLMSSMPCMRKIYPSVYENRNDRDKAAEIFFKHMKGINEPGKYQEFLSALEAHKYSLVVDIIKDGTISNIDEENERLIALFLKRLADAINPDHMSQELLQRQLISESEAQRVCNLARNDSTLDAALFLLSRIHCRKKTWYSEFLEVLWYFNHCELVKDIDDKFHMKKMKESQSGDDLDSSLTPSSIESTEPNFDMDQPNAVCELALSSGRSYAPVSADGNIYWEDAPQPKQSQTPPSEQDLMQTMLTQLKILSNQLIIQRDSVAQVSDRLLTLEGKVDQILEKLK